MGAFSSFESFSSSSSSSSSSSFISCCLNSYFPSAFTRKRREGGREGGWLCCCHCCCCCICLLLLKSFLDFVLIAFPFERAREGGREGGREGKTVSHLFPARTTPLPSSFSSYIPLPLPPFLLDGIYRLLVHNALVKVVCIGFGGLCCH